MPKKQIKESHPEIFEPLDEEERELIESLERDEWQSAPDLKKRNAELQQIARNTLAKNKRITIRISELDLQRIQDKALQEGIPYQTLIASIIHKFNEGTLVDKTAVEQVIHQLRQIDF